MDKSSSLLSCLIRVRISSAMLCPRGGMDDHTGFRFRRRRFESCRGCSKGLGVAGNITVSKTVVACSNLAAPAQTRERNLLPFHTEGQRVHSLYGKYSGNAYRIEYIFRSINRRNHLPPKQELRIQVPPGMLKQITWRSTAVSTPG